MVRRQTRFVHHRPSQRPNLLEKCAIRLRSRLSENHLRARRKHQPRDACFEANRAPPKLSLERLALIASLSKALPGRSSLPDEPRRVHLSNRNRLSRCAQHLLAQPLFLRRDLNLRRLSLLARTAFMTHSFGGSTGRVLSNL